MNLIDHIGNKVNIWTKEGNTMENRTLITADEMGVVVSPYSGDDIEVFVPWNRVKYIDLIKNKPPSMDHPIPTDWKIPTFDVPTFDVPTFKNPILAPYITCETDGKTNK